MTALSPLLVAALPLGGMNAPTAYGLFEMAMGVGLVGGGLAIGAVADKLPKGPAIVAGVHGHRRGAAAVRPRRATCWLALVLAGVVGLANVAFVVPSQTIFQQRTPDEMLGRVVAIRLAMVNAALAVAMATSGLLAELFGLNVGPGGLRAADGRRGAGRAWA